MKIRLHGCIVNIKSFENKIRIIFKDGGFIETDSAESFLLFSILQKLEEIRGQNVDVKGTLSEIKDKLIL